MTPSGRVPVSLQSLEPLERGLFQSWVRRAILVTTLAYLAALAGDLTLGDPATRRLASGAELGVVVAGLAALVLVRSGRAMAGALVLLAAVWTELHAWLFFFGMTSTALVAFPVVVAAAGMILGGRGAFVLAGISVLTVVVAGYLSTAGSGWGLSGQDRYMVLITAAAMFAMAALVQLGLDSLGRALMAARASEQRLSSILNYSPDGVVATDAQGRILGANPAAEDVLGCGEEELRGESFTTVLARCCLGELGGWSLASLMADGAGHALSVRDTSDRLRWIDITVGPVPWADGTQGYQVTLRDVTERREAEDVRQAMRAQLEHAQRLEAVGRLAGGVAHEFNNILTVVGGSAELLLESRDVDSRDLAYQIKSAQVRGAGLTKQLLAFARRDLFQPRRMSVVRTIRDMGPLLQQVLTRRVVLDLDLPEEGVIVADRAQLEQILVNVVLNAKDAIQAGGRVTVGVALPGTRRRWAGGDTEWVVDPGVLELWVEDDGVGMTAETQRLAFEPFFTTKKPGVGTGLGLATVHGIVVQNGGRVRILSKPDVGTVLIVSWPLAVGA